MDLQPLKHFVNGLVAGWTQVIIMQPFEKIKVLLQTQGVVKQYNGIVDCFNKVMKTEGPLGFYKGTLVPLLGIGSIGSVRFGTFQNFKIKLKEITNTQGELPLAYKSLAAFGTGLISSLLLCPIQHTRIRIQMQKTAAEKVYSGSLNAAVVIFRNYGFRGLNKGQVPTTLRQSTGLCFFFTVIEYLTKLLTPEGVDKKNAPIYVPLLAGGIGGTAYWCFNYPLDYMKTLIQTDSFEKPKYKNILDCYRQQVVNGPQVFFKGYVICMMRSFPVNAGALISYRGMQKLLNVQN